MFRHIPIACLLCLLLFAATPASAEGTLKINTSIKPPFSTEDETGFFDLLVKELGTRLDVQTELVRLPPERALVSANENISDAELPRIAGMEKNYPNLVMVDEPVVEYNFVAFSKRCLRITSWDDLDGVQTSYLIGWKIFENNVPRTAEITRLRTPESMFAMLDVGRTEVALYERYAGRNILKELNLPLIRECEGPLAVKPMYLYFHKSHVGLADKAAEALRQMKRDGTYQRIHDQTLGQ